MDFDRGCIYRLRIPGDQALRDALGEDVVKQPLEDVSWVEPPRATHGQVLR